MSGRISDNYDAPISEINIVPFVDIILVVLIIFMVTTPLIMKPSFKVNVPKAGSGDSTAPSKFQVSITAAGTVAINGRAAAENEIGPIAASAAKNDPNLQAVIMADRTVSHGRVVAVLDLIKQAGITRFAITIDNKQ